MIRAQSSCSFQVRMYWECLSYFYSLFRDSRAACCRHRDLIGTYNSMTKLQLQQGAPECFGQTHLGVRIEFKSQLSYSLYRCTGKCLKISFEERVVHWFAEFANFHGVNAFMVANFKLPRDVTEYKLGEMCEVSSCKLVQVSFSTSLLATFS